MQRLDRILSEAGVASRKELRAIIRAGRVTADGAVEKIIRVSFRREEKNHRAIIKIENTYTNKDVNIDDIFKKGFSGKENHSGIGLWEVRKYIKNRKNSDLFTSKNDKFFSQELTIYDTK